MVFSSNIFLFVFLPFTLLGNFLLPKKFRNVFLLLCSLFFYGWGEPRTVFIMMGSILLNYASGLAVDYAQRHNKKGLGRLALVASVALNLGILCYYKYMDFFITTINRTTGLHIPLLYIVLPIGISFFTFQGMSYVLDVYMGNGEVTKNPLDVGLYIALFPQLIAGPIVRYQDVYIQIHDRTITLEKFSLGVWRFAVGLAKKLLLANNMGLVADGIFSIQPGNLSPAMAWLGVLCYAMQIYFDFSGYSDMAIGLGKMIGFDFLENFNYPYISRTITEFWRRWHISLSTWFRDYVYIPLGGNRKGNQYVNLFVVFLLTGLWHGAAWQFVIWGLWHGAFLIIEKLLQKRGILQKIPAVLGWALSMLVVLIGWVMFRAEGMTYALGYMRSMFGLQTFVSAGYTLPWFLNAKVATILVISALACVPWRQVRPFSALAEKMAGSFSGLVLRNAVSIGLLLMSFALVMTSTYNPFIYFRF